VSLRSGRVDREEALDRLAGLYARALRLADAGWSEPDIARDLGIEPAAVRPLLEIGARKLARLMADDADP
jgi:DNA-directed RNA polymerase specialized sigma24 family protein